VTSTGKLRRLHAIANTDEALRSFLERKGDVDPTARAAAEAAAKEDANRRSAERVRRKRGRQ
jgi:hypothetical protein